MHIIIDKYWILECQTSRPTAIEKKYFVHRIML